MDSMKIISDNAAKRAAISATPLASSTPAAWMLTDVKSQVCRATGTSMTITLIWPTPERVGGAHYPHWNGSPNSTMRVRGYSDVAGTVKVIDTGVQLANPWAAIKLLGSWTSAAAASAYEYGGGAHARSWFDNTTVRRLDIDLVDPANLQGYVEVSDIFVGEWWAPTWNADYNPGLTAGGTGVTFRDASGARRSTRGTRSRRMSVSLSHLTEADRDALWQVLLANGTEIPIIFSLYPNSAFPTRERDHQMYCALAASGSMRRSNFADHATQLDLETV